MDEEYFEAISQYMIAEKYKSYFCVGYGIPSSATIHQIRTGLIGPCTHVVLNTFVKGYQQDAQKIRKDHPDLRIEFEYDNPATYISLN